MRQIHIRDSEEQAEGTQARDNRIQADQVLQLYSQSRWGFIGALLSAFVLVVALWSVVSQARLLVWLVCYLCVQVVRYLLVASYHRASPSVQDAASWGRWFALSTIASGLVWGSAGVFLFPVHSISHQFLLALFLAGISSAAAVVYSATVQCFLPTVLAALLPISARYLYQGDELGIIIGSVILVFAGVLSLTGRHMHRTNADSLRLRFERSELIESLEKARNELEFRVEERTSELVRINEKLQGEIEHRKEAQEDFRQSEAKYRRIVENTQDVIYQTDVEGRLIFASPSSVRILDYTPEEVLGRRLSEFYVFPEERTRLLNLLLENGSVTDYEAELTRKDGSRVWVSTNARLLKDQSGKPIGVEEVTRDVTVRKEAEEALRESGRKFRETVMYLDEGYYSCTLDGILLEHNRAFNQLLGLEISRDLTGTSLPDFWRSPNDRAEYVNELMGKGIIRNYPINAKRATGERLVVMANAHLVKDENKRQVRIQGTFTDITDLKKAEELLRASEEKYRSLFNNAEVGMFRTRLDGSEILDMNERFLKIFGRTREEMHGNPAVIHWADPREREEMVHRLNTDGRVTDFECKMLNKEGEERNCVTSLRLYRENGILEGSIIDVTERKQAEEALRESEKRYRELVEKANDIIYLTDANGHLLLFNAVGLKITGYSQEEIVHKHYLDLIHPDYKKQVERFYGLQFVKRIPDTYHEVPIISHQGETVWIGQNVQLVKEGDTVVGFQAICRDITDRKRAEDELWASEERLELALRGADLGLWDWNLKTGRAVWDERATGMLGYSPDEMEPSLRTWKSRVHPEDWPNVSEVLNGHLEGRLPLLEVEYRIRCKSGEWKWILGRGKIVGYDTDGKPLRITGTSVDITERRAAEQERERLAVQLRQGQKMEAVGTLAGGIAHDFNNLLHIISGHAELLDMELAERKLKFGELDAIRQSAHRGADLVKQILTFSRRIDSKFESINLNEEVRSTERLLYRTIPKMIEIDLRLDEGLDRVRADSTQIEQMLINLAVNANDAMPEGGRLAIETRNVNLDEHYCKSHAEIVPGQYVLLKVSDTGHGMEEGVLRHIFEPFFTTKGLADGTGLGLATVFGIVKMHKGHITCESEVGRGTTFEIYFPVAEAARPEVVGDQEVTAVAGGAETILVVDDEPMIRDLAKRILDKSGYSVLTAGSGKEGIEIYAQHKTEISLVILDLIMPEMGGKQCLEELLKINPQVKAVIASGFAVKGDTKAFLDTEAKGIVPKPFNMRELLRSVRHVLDGI